MLEDQRSGPECLGAVPQGRHREGGGLADHRHRVPDQAPADRIQKELSQPGQRASHHDHLGVDQVRHVAERASDGEAGVVHDAQGGGVPGDGLADDVLRRQGPVLAAAQELDHGGGGGDGLQAAPVAAAADQPVFVDGGMADLTGDPHVAVVGCPVEDQAGADARADLEEHQVANAAVGSPGDLGQRAQVGVVVQENRELQGFFEALQDVDAHPFGQDGSLRHGSRAPVDGAGNADAGAHQGGAFHAAVSQQPVQHADRCGDAFLGVVAEGEQDGFLGNDVVAERGEDHPQVPAAEVDSDGDGPVAVQPDVQGAPPGAGDGLGGRQSGVLHDLDDVGDRGRGKAGLAGQFGLRGRAGQEAFDDPLLVQVPERGL